jgi:hypothetical protein
MVVKAYCQGDSTTVSVDVKSTTVSTRVYYTALIKLGPRIGKCT